MTLAPEDVLSIHQLLALHGHLVDSGDLHRLDELFAAGAEYDVSALGQGVIRGIDQFRATTEAFADDPRNPVAHHVTNIVVTESSDGAVTARSKGLGVQRDGRVGSVVYADQLCRTPRGWRITARRVFPTGPSDGP